ncbi:multicopper oxidase family protein [Aphanothece sacrum]|uniref:Multicopper oxidase n=1 Tax=Aphanothece sacrum FPU1 TaxID=1920663 RepID=A0A401IHD4_APHSA|nr:multicopper oxidase family protein [Aphanothece sacrum]GBF80616.1 multicopper oxidase [Aphanothece sacrum FPU1]GBF83994.1 multicopper oxidase [Aphanothece sacrum FPU3]
MTDKYESITPETTKFNLSRRLFLATGVGTLAALAIPNKAKADPNNIALITDTSTNFGTTPTLTPPSDKTFPQPGIKASDLGVIKAKWIVNQDNIPLGEYQGFIRFYADTSAPDVPFIPAPTLCLNPGDIIEINLQNTLLADDKSCQNPVFNQPNCFNTTNLHFHGLHVSPLSMGKDGIPVSGGHPSDVEFSSDDVLMEIQPGETNNYLVQLPKNHAPGTHWYHSHRHGSTAVQVSNAMAGAIIIKEPSDQAICPDAPDVLWILQDVLSDGRGQGGIIDDNDVYIQQGRNNEGECLVNGKYQPTLTIQKGEIQRWRFVNAGSTPRTLMNLKLCKGTLKNVSDCDNNTLQTMYLIARDGINFYGKKPKSQTTHAFSPGNRSDFLVNLEPGNYTLIKDVYTGTKNVYGDANDPSQAVNSNASKFSKQVIAYITVTNTPYSKAEAVKNQFDTLQANGIPTTGMANYLNPITGPVIPNPKKVEFEASRGVFTIDNIKFGDPNAKFTVALNSQEEWILDNTSGVTHPFHIHVNPFQVVAIGTKSGGTITWKKVPEADLIWQDTVGIDPNIPLKIQHRFDDYNGTYVLHCHILIHEDQGMMYEVEVTGNGIPPGSTAA